MLKEISYYTIFGVPIIVYLGSATLILFIITAFLALLIQKRMIKTSIQWHFRIAYISIVVGIIHGGLGILTYV